MEGLKKEVQQHKSDKIYLEKMVDRLNREMENRIINIKNDNATALNNKDDQIRELYSKVRELSPPLTIMRCICNIRAGLESAAVKPCR